MELGLYCLSTKELRNRLSELKINGRSKLKTRKELIDKLIQINQHNNNFITNWEGDDSLLQRIMLFVEPEFLLNTFSLLSHKFNILLLPFSQFWVDRTKQEFNINVGMIENNLHQYMFLWSRYNNRGRYVGLRNKDTILMNNYLPVYSSLARSTDNDQYYTINMIKTNFWGSPLYVKNKCQTKEVTIKFDSNNYELDAVKFLIENSMVQMFTEDPLVHTYGQMFPGISAPNGVFINVNGTIAYDIFSVGVEKMVYCVPINFNKIDIRLAYWTDNYHMRVDGAGYIEISDEDNKVTINSELYVLKKIMYRMGYHDQYILHRALISNISFHCDS